MAFDLQLVLFVLFIGISLLLVLIILTPGIPDFVKVFIALASLVLDILAFSTRYYAYFMMPFIKRKGNTVVLNSNEPFVVAPSNNAIITREGANVYASAYVKIPIYRSATEMSTEEKLEFARLFAKLVTISKDTFKLTTQMYVINKDDYISSIRTKLNDAEEKYRELSNDSNADRRNVERAKGEVTMWHNLFDNVGRIQSSALSTYAMVSAVGGNDEEAVTIALQRAQEIAAGVSATLGITAYVVEGNELLTFVEPDYMIPLATVSERIRQRTIEEGM